MILQNITYKHPNLDVLFNEFSFQFNNSDKLALIGNNGVGKSILLKILAGKLHTQKGEISDKEYIYYIPQIFDEYEEKSVSEVLNIAEKLNALLQILDRNVTDENLNILDNDWNIEETCREAFEYWKIENIKLSDSFKNLSGGQKTKVFLAGSMIHQPNLILMDEPTNHLDFDSKNKLYDFINDQKKGFLIVSHDRILLNKIDYIAELSPNKIKNYGGNYDFYLEQKGIEKEAFQNELKSKEKHLKQAKEIAKMTLESMQKQDSRGKKKQEKAGLPKILQNSLRNSAENSSAKMKDIHQEKLGNLEQELSQLRRSIPLRDQIKIDLKNSSINHGKKWMNLENINFKFNENWLWKENISFEISNGDRIAVKGKNGSGKTTLLNLILGKLQVSKGNISNNNPKIIYIDQHYSLLKNHLTIDEQIEKFNIDYLPEHELKIRLTRHLFYKNSWNKKIENLSGGERMRLLICCITLSENPADIIILDEPTNNLDIQNIEILTEVMQNYHGSLILVSHDEKFVNDMKINKEINLG